jgi:hypothetical protein
MDPPMRSTLKLSVAVSVLAYLGGAAAILVRRR